MRHFMAIYLTFGNIKVTKSTNNVKNLNFKVCVIRKKTKTKIQRKSGEEEDRRYHNQAENTEEKWNEIKQKSLLSFYFNTHTT